MKKKILLSGVLAVAICFCILLWVFVGARNNLVSKPEHTEPRRISYGFSLRNETSKALKDVHFYTTAPVEETLYQTCGDISASRNYETETGPSGNQLLKFTIPVIPPYGTSIIRVESSLKTAAEPYKPNKSAASDDPAQKAVPQISPDDVLKRAAEFKGQTPSETVTRICQWMAANMKIETYNPRPLPLNEILSRRSGDCTEMMTLFLALAEKCDLKARGVAGYICVKDQVLKPSNFHNWVEIQDGDLWIPVDPSKFDNPWNTQNHLALQIIDENRPSHWPRFYRFYIDNNHISAVMDGA